MANPNIVAVTTINGKTAVANVSTISTALITNSADSGIVVKVNLCLISNITTIAEDITVELERSSVSYFITKDISVPAGTTLDVLNKSLYLQEGDKINVSASSNSSLQVICSYEEIS